MQSTISVSKGCFVFKGSSKTAKTTNRSRKSTSLLSTEYKSQRWYQAYARMWQHISKEHEKLQLNGYTKTMDYLQKFVGDSLEQQHRHHQPTNSDAHNLPATALLTGINQPDHFHLFKTFARNIRKSNDAIACIIQSRDCPSLKSAIETMVAGLMNDHHEEMLKDKCIDDDEIMEVDMSPRKLRRSQYTMAVLKAWYEEKFVDNCLSPILTVIIPDFENFPRDVLHQFILLLSHNFKDMPTALILGVATDLATLHRTLSFSDANRLSLHVSQSQPSTQSLSQILDEIMLTPRCPLMLSAKVYTLLTDIFLYYDLSINSFMQGFKFCLMGHYNQSNAYSLCTTYSESLRSIHDLQPQDLMAIRRLISFRSYVESMTDCRQVIATSQEDTLFKQTLCELVTDIHIFRTLFYWALRVLLGLVQDLPKNLLGKQLRDLYAKCAVSSIVDSAEFQSSWDLLAFMAKDELVRLLAKVHAGMCSYVSKYCEESDHVSQVCSGTIHQIAGKFEMHIDSIRNAGTSSALSCDHESPPESQQFNSTTKVQSRLELQAKLLEMSKKPKTTNAFTQAVNEALEFLRKDVLARYLLPFKCGPPLLELFLFDDLSAIRAHIMGAPRAALHTGLHNPQNYLQCECCTIENASQMTPTLPDLSIVYKLHLESGRMINLFDWMQAFQSIVGGEVDYDENEPISPQIQARFTRAVAELQFLGFIKGSKRKTDHVTRLTW